MSSRYLVEDDHRHVRAVLVSTTFILPFHGLFLLTPWLVPHDLSDLSPVFYWPLLAIRWFGLLGWAPMLVICMTVLAGVYLEATKRFLFTWRFFLYRWTYLTGFLGVIWMMIVGGLWLSLVAFWGRV